jgi:hypothetical protein
MNLSIAGDPFHLAHFCGQKAMGIQQLHFVPDPPVGWLKANWGASNTCAPATGTHRVWAERWAWGMVPQKT